MSKDNREYIENALF